MWIASAKRRHDASAGRFQQPLGPITVEIPAPPQVVFDVIAAPYLGKTPRAMSDKLRVLDRGSNLVVADHYTPILRGKFIVTTRETVYFESPTRVKFRLLSGPVATVDEEYLLDATDSGAKFTYQGTLTSNLPILGAWWARTNARAWTAVVRTSIEEIAAEATRRHH